MTNQFKRIIAREGLVLLATVGVGTILISLALYFRPSLDDIFNNVPLAPMGTILWGTIIGIGQTFLVAYPIYLLIRFIFWAIKTLELQRFLAVQIQRTIVKESLILLAIILFGGILFKMGDLSRDSFKERYWQEKIMSKAEFFNLSKQDKQEAYKQYENEFTPDIIWALKHKTTEAVLENAVIVLGRWILFFGYPVYMLVRFILWAIRTLREK